MARTIREAIAVFADPKTIEKAVYASRRAEPGSQFYPSSDSWGAGLYNRGQKLIPAARSRSILAMNPRRAFIAVRNGSSQNPSSGYPRRLMPLPAPDFPVTEKINE
jgi:hypothetical protein